MLKHKAYKFRIYPTTEQEILIAKTIGKGLSYSSCSKEISVLKQELDWLKEVDSTSVQNSVKHLAEAYDRFFNRRDDGGSLARFRSLDRMTQESSTS
ncbi:helix-turn-helix domain-containing protein [Exiguobacterium sp.]|uniref:helix-turn-helix domain-containing protein n=1 Tax=Exiguobacterium sp. TaxID=44751 RepID=UPI0039199A6B